MTEQEINSLKKGDVICYPHPNRNYFVYGLIDEDGTLYCSHILGDGDSNIHESDIFYYSEPTWLESYDCITQAGDEEARLFKILCEEDNRSLKKSYCINSVKSSVDKYYFE